MATDIPAGDWIDRRLPAGVRPYLRLMRIDRPVGIWLLMFPCCWSTALATPGWPDPWFLVLFAMGAAIMRGAGCILNDIADRRFDARVARTAGRPIPSGAVSVRQAFAFMIALCFAGLVVLLQFNLFTVGVGASSLVLVGLYPFAKRVTYWPQAVLGLTFSWGALLGWAAVRGDLGLPAIVLYAAGLLWTLGYDTIYAHQDKEDDILIGVKSTALRLGAATKPWLWAFYAGCIGLLALAGALVGLSWPFYAVLAGVAVQFCWQVMRLDVEDPKDCLAKFKSNQTVGLMVFAAIVLARAAPSGTDDSAPILPRQGVEREASHIVPPPAPVLPVGSAAIKALSLLARAGRAEQTNGLSKPISGMAVHGQRRSWPQRPQGTGE